eukprot:TRINITY_DN55318_c0_g1_i1.p1 TRINITY_DN55318_c0_g1~~TRINITY_DN55318_c0_g1_i1.p1  ORF type:complete len:436 (-),score=43.25 TRINITY_DN55318_c0_g1_i1:24-1331(-)
MDVVEALALTQPVAVIKPLSSSDAEFGPIALAEKLCRSVVCLQRENDALRNENALLKESLARNGLICQPSCASSLSAAAENSTVAPRGAFVNVSSLPVPVISGDLVDAAQSEASLALLTSAAAQTVSVTRQQQHVGDSTQVSFPSQGRPSSISLFLARSRSMSRNRPRWLKNLEAVITVVILADVFLAGVETTVHWTGFWFLDVSFMVAYVVELQLKVRQDGLHGHYIESSQKGWNVFDTILVILSICDTIIQSLARSPHSIALRLCRVSRLIRLVRVVRLPEFQYVEVIVYRFSAGMKSLKGSIILLLFLVWCVAVVVAQLIGQDMAGDDERFKGFNHERDVLFSNVFSSFLTVFRCVNGDCSMQNGCPLAVAFSEAYGVWFAIPYMFSVAVFTYGMLNLAMALFVESTLSDSVLHSFRASVDPSPIQPRCSLD